MNTNEYRIMACLTIPYITGVLSAISSRLLDLDQRTLSERTHSEKVTQGNRTVHKVFTTPLTDEQMKEELTGLEPTIDMVLSVIEPLTDNAWTLQQIAEFINSSEHKDYWNLEDFEACQQYNDREIRHRLNGCVTSLKHCIDISQGDGIMDTVNSMIAFVIVNVKTRLLEVRAILE